MCSTHTYIDKLCQLWIGIDFNLSIIQILECVAVNLTLIYALLAHSAIKQKDFSTVYVSKLHCICMAVQIALLLECSYVLIGVTLIQRHLFHTNASWCHPQN